jgi:acyl carrier protein
MTSLASNAADVAVSDQVDREIRARIAEYVGVGVKDIRDDAELNEDLGLDLLEVSELIVVLEEMFVGRTFINEPDRIESVGDLIGHIERHR